MKIPTPTGAQALAKKDEFERFLSERGAEVLAPTNEWEIVRFKSGKGTSIMYRSKDADKPVSCIGGAMQAWREFVNPESRWRAIPATKRRSPVSAEYRTIRQRDGNDCFFCAEFIPEGEGTIEHLVAVTHGGPQHISNKFLAHKECNAQAGCMSAVEKIKLYHKSRLEKLLRRIDEQGRRDRLASDSDFAQACDEQAR